MRTSESAETLRVHGMNLAPQDTTGRYRSRTRHRVLRIIETASDRIDIEVRVAAAVGERDLLLDQP